jgi:hypothetical protein
MAMSFHLLVRSSGPLRAQARSPFQRSEQEFAVFPGLAVAVIKTKRTESKCDDDS